MMESPTSSRFSFTVGTPTAAIVILIIAFVFMLLIGISTFVYTISTSPNYWYVGALFVVAVGGMGFYISRLFVKYTVDEEGFLKHGRGDSKERVLTWRDISAIRPQRGGGEGVELLNGRSEAVVKVHGALAGYENLIELIPQMRPDLWDFQGERTFQKWGDIIFLALFALFFILLGIFVGDMSAIVPKVIFFGIGAFILWLLWGTPYKIVVRPQEVELVSVQNRKRYTPTDIRNVTVERHRSRNRVSYVPTLELHDGKKVYLGGFAGGAVNTYGTMLRWWERNRI